MRLDEWLRESANRLTVAGVERSRLEAEVLAAHVLREPRAWLIAHPEHEFPELAGENVLQRRLGHEPLPYIVGWREFYGRRFAVRPGVLIPRHETEVLVDAALEIGASWPLARVLDVGTGSGCIAATLKLERPRWTAVASDLSLKALMVAVENFSDLGAEVLPVNADGCSAFGHSAFEMVVTNPPYVAIEDCLPEEIKEWEPHEALFADDQGSGFYKRLSCEVPQVLAPDGFLLMELGRGQRARVEEIFEDAGWEVRGVWRDLLGIERVLAVSRKESSPPHRPREPRDTQEKGRGP